jgi:hypothetical protein
MFGNKNRIIGSAFLALGFLNSSVYASSADVQQRVPSDEEASEIEILEEEVSKEEMLRNIFESAETLVDLMPAAKLIHEGVDYAELFAERDEYRDPVTHTANNSSILAVALFLPGANINARDIKGNTALHAWSFFLFETDFPSKDYLTALEILIKAGADVDLENDEGETPRQVLEKWVVEEEVLPEEERSFNSVEKLQACREAIQIFRVADAGAGIEAEEEVINEEIEAEVGTKAEDKVEEDKAGEEETKSEAGEKEDKTEGEVVIEAEAGEKEVGAEKAEDKVEEDKAEE